MSKALVVVALCTTAVGCGSAASPTGPTSEPVALVSLVADGGYVVFFRHAERNGAALSTEALLLVDRAGECVEGSELTPAGIADAIAIGAAFRRRRIEVHRVYASPTCRTQQMARLAFDQYETSAALAWPEIWNEDQASLLAEVLPVLLGTRPPRGKTTVLISHNGVLVPTRMGLDVALDQGEAAVFLPSGSGAFQFMGKISKAEWLAIE